MSKQLKPSQKLATNPEISARVMANAGAGKTFVLTARVLRLLLKGVRPGKILCLTYTKAAAAEMRERINHQLEKWVLMDDAELRQELAQLIEAEPDQKQIDIAKKLFSLTLESSPPPRIQTIHSFCQDVLKRFPLESGIQPYFEIADDITAKELIKETTQILLSAHQQEEEIVDAINFIAADAGENKFNEVIAEIIMQRNRIRDLFDSYDSPQQIVESIYARHDCDGKDCADNQIKGFFDFHPERADHVERLAQAMMQSANKNDVGRGEKLLTALRQKNFSEYNITFMTKEGEPRKNIITKEGKKFFAEPDEVIAYEQEQLTELLNNIDKLDNLNFTKHVIYLSFGILETYDALKRSQALIDYNDLIYSTKKLLTTSDNTAWVLYKLDGGIDHILVDEAQDTSPEQWQIILALLEEFMAGEGAAGNERTIFVVGDEKQSIYSFQGADQKKFNLVIDRIQAMCNSAQKPFRDIQLETSFRSVEAVLKIADTTFAPEHLRASVSSSPREIEHLLNRVGEGGHVEIWPIIRNEEKDEIENWQLPINYHSAKSADLLLAEKISDTIGEWLKSGRKLAATGKTIRPSDILILLRSRGSMADMLINRLKRNKIPVSGSDRLKITDHIAIQDLLALGNFLLLPADDLSLAALLKSPLFGISEEDLFELCYNRTGSLWNNLRSNNKFSSISEILTALFNRTDFISVYELYSLVLDELGGRKKMIARLGDEVNDVLDEFLDLAVNFERSHTSSLQHFISWVGLSSMEIKRDMEAANDEVRIMTVHGAKGLEAPIVFLADAAKLPRGQRQLIWDEPHFYSYKTKSRLFRGLRDFVETAENADYDEYLRLLYVAITRARDELYICGSVGEKNTNIDKSWFRLVENAMLAIGTKDEESGIFRHQTQHQNEKALIAADSNKVPTPLPDFLFKKLAKAETISSDIDELVEFNELKDQIDYGKKVHKVLEVIGQIAADKRGLYLDYVFKDDKITISEITKLLTVEEFAEFFAASAKSEVPIIGKVGNRIISGRIDRMVVGDKELKIIDFKTSRNIPKNMPQAYINQMDIYAQIIAPQYPEHKVRKFILWTAAARLVQLA